MYPTLLSGDTGRHLPGILFMSKPSGYSSPYPEYLEFLHIPSKNQNSKVSLFKNAKKQLSNGLHFILSTWPVFLGLFI